MMIIVYEMNLKSGQLRALKKLGWKYHESIENYKPFEVDQTR